MTPRQLKILSAIFALFVIFGVTYATYYITLRHRLTGQLVHAGYHQIEITGFRPFIDGVVIDKLQLDHRLVFSMLYLRGDPLKMLVGQPEYIYIGQGYLYNTHLFAADLRWPFPTALPLIVKQFAFDRNILDQTVRFSGTLKQKPDQPLQFDFTSLAPVVTLAGQAEIRTDAQKITAIDFQFQDAELNFPFLKTKRMTGWFGLARHQNWEALGEIDAGYGAIGPHPFFDMNLKFSGPVAAVSFNFAGKDNVQKSPVIMDQEQNTLTIQRENVTIPSMQWTGLNNTALQNITVQLDKNRDQNVKKTKKRKY